MGTHAYQRNTLLMKRYNMTTLRVHFIDPLPTKVAAHLKKHSQTHLEITEGPEPPERADYQVLVGISLSESFLTASPVIESVVVPIAGISSEIRTLMQRFPHIRLHNLHHNARQVAEMALTLMLCCAKSVIPADRALRRGNWDYRYIADPGSCIERKTAIVLGFGHIGKRIAELCRALNMRVIAIKRSVDPNADAAPAHQLFPVADIDALLPEADFLFICLPCTEETSGLFQRDRLASLPKRCVLINVGRAEIINETALFESLKKGSIKAAGLDVWYNYPKLWQHKASHDTAPAHLPFHTLPNVVMSPHVAEGQLDAKYYELRKMEYLAIKLDELAGNVCNGYKSSDVDLKRGY
jgi:phosphoglycerate dehydrogenase-like enzyme